MISGPRQVERRSHAKKHALIDSLGSTQVIYGNVLIHIHEDSDHKNEYCKRAHARVKLTSHGGRGGKEQSSHRTQMIDSRNAEISDLQILLVLQVDFCKELQV